MRCSANQNKPTTLSVTAVFRLKDCLMSMTIMRFAITFFLCFVMANATNAMLRGDPTISSAAIDPLDPNVVYLRLTHLYGKAAISTNGGLTFQLINEQELPPNLVTNLSAGTRRYVLADPRRLFRSDDAGVTWTNTAITTFMEEKTQETLDQEVKRFRDEYGPRLPSRSVFWHPLFGLFSGSYFLLTLFALRPKGWPKAILKALQGLVVILLVWCLLWAFHAIIRQWTESQYPYAFWNTSCLLHPGPKIGLAMAIAARPFPLFLYLLALWPLLPGSMSVMGGTDPSLSPTRRCVSFAVSIAIGSARRW
jgi:hypothetical protein